MRRIIPSLFSSFRTEVLHITDTEGTSAFLNTIQRNNIVGVNDSGLYFKGKGKPYFIFGGDATDRGRFDLTTTELLVDFKKRHPEQVFLLAGNREIKNTRFAIELNSHTIKERLLKTQTPYWLSKETRPLDYLIKALREKGEYTEVNPTQDALQREIKMQSTQQCQLYYLHWMLEKTMGCPLTFRFRRDELARLKNKTAITDSEVLESFVNENQPEGLMGQYLQLANVGVIVPGTGILAVHGGLTSNNIGRVPGRDNEYIQNAVKWIEEMNHWFTKQINAWKKRVTSPSTEIIQPGLTELDASVLPVPGKEKYVMTADMLNANRQFVAVPTDVDSYLQRNQIHLVLTGHQPIGDHPSLLRSPHALFINGDTGYANGASNPEDTRGNAHHSLEITADKEKSTVQINAVSSDNQSLETTLTVSNDKIEGDPHIGTLLNDHRLVQCKLPNGKYRIATQEMFNVKYTTENLAPQASLSK